MNVLTDELEFNEEAEILFDLFCEELDTPLKSSDMLALYKSDYYYYYYYYYHYYYTRKRLEAADCVQGRSDGGGYRDLYPPKIRQSKLFMG